jgi:cold shock CspA family protein
MATSGRVKWFNNKAGYGFITTNDCETNEERDIFVHHSEIKVEQTQYKYLVQGEYVEFVIAPVSREGSIEVHATSVCGINSGKLMCETRNEVRTYRATTQPARQSRAQAQQTPAEQTTAQQTPTEQTQAQQTPTEQTQAQQTQAKPVKQYKQAQQTQAKQTQAPVQAQRPQLAQADQTEWMVVPRRRTETTPSRPKNQPRQRKPEIEIAQ